MSGVNHSSVKQVREQRVSGVNHSNVKEVREQRVSGVNHSNAVVYVSGLKKRSFRSAVHRKPDCECAKPPQTA